jgi:ACS family glucarate transporter-like MFS transporter
MEKTIIPIRVALISASAFFTLLIYIDRICLSTAKDSIMSDICLSMTQFGWVMAFFTLGYGMFQPLQGRVADNYWLRKVFTTVVFLHLRPR